MADVEQRVLSYNTRNRMLTCAVRHHNLYGVGDRELLPPMVKFAREHRLQMIGKGNNVVDFSYAGNVAYAHLLAAERLQPGTKVPGNAWIVTDGEPVPYRDFVDRMLSGTYELHLCAVHLTALIQTAVSRALSPAPVLICVLSCCRPGLPADNLIIALSDSTDPGIFPAVCGHTVWADHSAAAKAVCQ